MIIVGGGPGGLGLARGLIGIPGQGHRTRRLDDSANVLDEVWTSESWKGDLR